MREARRPSLGVLIRLPRASDRHPSNVGATAAQPGPPDAAHRTGAGSAVTDATAGHHRTRRRLRKEIKWGLSAFVVVILLEYLVLPSLGKARGSLHQVASVNLAYVLAGLVLEAAALLAYSELTRIVLPDPRPKRLQINRVNLSSLGLSHVVPGGTAAGTALAFRNLTQEGVGSADTGFALALQGLGSAVVLNVVFWGALVVSIFLHGYNPLYAVAAGAGVLLMATFATVVVLLTRGHYQAAEVVRRWADKVPFLDAERLAQAVRHVADRLRGLGADRKLLRRAVAWAAANWLLDAASLWVSIAAFHKLINPVDLLVAYGLANILAAIPVTPGGLGVVEGVLVPTLSGFHVPHALLPVLLYRLWNFWLPIPVGGAAYLSLRFSGQGWRQRLREVREEVVEHGAQPPEEETAGGAAPLAPSAPRAPADRSADSISRALSDPGHVELEQVDLRHGARGTEPSAVRETRRER